MTVSDVIAALQTALSMAQSAGATQVVADLQQAIAAAQSIGGVVTIDTVIADLQTAITTAQQVGAANVVSALQTALVTAQSIGQGPPPMTPEQDFANRIASPSVVRYFDFNSAAQLNQRRAFPCNNDFGDVVTDVGTGPQQGNTCAPSLDPSIKASGASSLKFTFLSQSGQGAAGQFYFNFSPDCAALFGPTTEPQQAHYGDEFYLQWAQYWSAEILQTKFQTYPVNGVVTAAEMKFAIITAGDVAPGWQARWPKGKDWAFCERIELVITRHGLNPFPVAYNECGAYQGLFTRLGGGNVNFQNAMPSPPGCLYSTVKPMGDGWNMQPVPGCFNLEPGFWYTFQAGFTLGPRDRVNRRFTNSTFKLWGSKKGQPSQLIIDWHPGVVGYFPLCDGYPDAATSDLAGPQWFGACVLSPYTFQKDPAQVHAPASTWIDEVIVSKTRIADPLV